MKYLPLVAAIGSLSPIYALPTMVRLGYPNCVSCHTSPQGGGLLNEYGRGIDEAQSLRAGEYQTGQASLPSLLTAGGHVEQDFRTVLSDAATRLPGGSLSQAFRTRFYYRTVTTLPKGWRITATAAAENEPSPRRGFPYDPAVVPGRALLPTLLMQYRPREGIELAVGRDQLPMGVYTGDLATFVKARNRYGFYDTPTQAKLFLWGKRWQAVPYAFAPSGREPAGVRERGGGILAEYDLMGRGKTVAGVNLLHGSERDGNRAMVSIYTRLGFGSWGILAEHDNTRRSYINPAGTSSRFNQSATFVQTFRAFREWLVASAVFERLDVEAPYRERLFGGRGELAARLSPHFTLGLRAGLQHDLITGRAAPVVTVQLAWKTVGSHLW